MPVREVVLDRDVRASLDLWPRSLLNRYFLRRTVSVLTLLAIDAASIACAALIAERALRGAVAPHLDHPPNALALGVATLATLIVFAYNGLYGLKHRRHSARRLLLAMLESVLLIVFAAALVRDQTATASIGFIWAVALVFTLCARSAYDWVLSRVFGSSDLRPILIVGRPETCERAGRLISQSVPAKECRLAGLVTDVEVGEEWQEKTGLNVLGDFDHLSNIVRLETPVEIIVTDADVAHEHIGTLMDLCRKYHIVLKLAAIDLDVGNSRLCYVPGFAVPLFVIKPPALAGTDFLVKRAVDLSAAIILLVALAPILLVTALAIKLTSRGPVFFVDYRVGLGQRPFRCYKFRTMCADAAERQAALEAFNEADGAIFKMKNDPRVTPVGRVLRRLSLDELPQLLNVLRGEMSLVGPRPLPLRDCGLLEDSCRQRHVVLPGMTGLWQVSGRSRLSFDEMIALDTQYIQEWSIGSDLSILARTVGAVLRVKGAY